MHLGRVVADQECISAGPGDHLTRGEADDAPGPDARLHRDADVDCKKIIDALWARLLLLRVVDLSIVLRH